MTYDDNNVFAKILRDELPSQRLHEDDHAIVIMDVMPQADGHLLVIPREPAETLFDLSPESAAHCIQLAQTMGRALQKAFEREGILIMQLNGKQAGQTVPHFHIHVVPTSLQTLLKKGHGADMEDPEKLAELADRIRRAL
ncbi:MAG: HIT family protein [Salinisphaeraceae bacterium]|jgi:histidine triad (HIT) family protein|nr:HIT family protein [Salinisphaeraceae bacterium]